MSSAKQKKMATSWLGQMLKTKHSKVWIWPGGLVLHNNKGPFVQVSFGLFETTSHFIWILCKKEARILKLLRAGFCSNLILLETATETVK